MDAFASAVIVFVGASILVTPIWILQAINNLQTKLAVITAFVLVCLLILSFVMVSKPFEALGATAAYVLESSSHAIMASDYPLGTPLSSWSSCRSDYDSAFTVVVNRKLLYDQHGVQEERGRREIVISPDVALICPIATADSQAKKSTD